MTSQFGDSTATTKTTPPGNCNLPGSTVTVNDLIKQGNFLTATLSLQLIRNAKPVEYCTPEYTLKHLGLSMCIQVVYPKTTETNSQTNGLGSPSGFGGGASVFGGLKGNQIMKSDSYFQWSLSVRVDTKLGANDNLKSICKFSSKALKIEDMQLPITNDFFVVIYECTEKPANSVLSFDVNFEADLGPSKSGYMGAFSSLYDDTDLIDFKLRTHDGSVQVHKMVLAAASAALYKELCGPWKEANEGNINNSEISKTTLVHFKEYLYLRKIPDNGVEYLLLLATKYEMPDLENLCIEHLVKTVNAENYVKWHDFANSHNITQLNFALLDLIQSGTIKVKDIREKFVG